MDAEWGKRRRRAVEVHAEALRRRTADEQARARELVAEFARTATERGLPTEPLLARGFGGRARYRTGLRGWYLKPDRSLAVATDGEFYILSVPDGLLARVRGARVTPARPGLTIGEGARDGESLPLAELLSLRLAQG